MAGLIEDASIEILTITRARIHLIENISGKDIIYNLKTTDVFSGPGIYLFRINTSGNIQKRLFLYVIETRGNEFILPKGLNK